MPVLIQIAGQQVNVVVEDQQASWAGKPLYDIEAWDLSLEVPDRDDKSKMKVLLDHVSFKAMPGDMIALGSPAGTNIERANPRWIKAGDVGACIAEGIGEQKHRFVAQP